MIQQVLRDELTLMNRVRTHARIAEALEEHYGDQAEEHAAELAEHFSQAGPLIDPQKAARYAISAGNVALAGYAFDDADRWFGEALKQLQGDAANTQLLGEAHLGKG